MKWRCRELSQKLRPQMGGMVFVQSMAMGRVDENKLGKKTEYVAGGLLWRTECRSRYAAILLRRHWIKGLSPLLRCGLGNEGSRVVKWGEEWKRHNRPGKCYPLVSRSDLRVAVDNSKGAMPPVSVCAGLLIAEWSGMEEDEGWCCTGSA